MITHNSSFYNSIKGDRFYAVRARKMVENQSKPQLIKFRRNTCLKNNSIASNNSSYIGFEVNRYRYRCFNNKNMFSGNTSHKPSSKSQCGRARTEHPIITDISK
ncbi:hypothetical protein O3G_MSEX011377 [Manduca sexta]|uniref:Uncharacterized protein n=1 Tax=Manduca sexta TaxID=7130 RepID=A0A921ZK13_MANSE|nr:hypothetical protein O3G_MSEX011377 [Manduca sexta]